LLKSPPFLYGGLFFLLLISAVLFSHFSRQRIYISRQQLNQASAEDFMIKHAPAFHAFIVSQRTILV
jgi:hypothetical protein